MESHSKGLSVAIHRTRGHGFGVGWQGGRGIKNNASEATKNISYLIDIISLFRLSGLTILSVYVYPGVMCTREQMQNTLIERLFWHTAERDDSQETQMLQEMEQRCIVI